MSDPTEGAAPPRSVLENSWVRFVHAASVMVGGERVVVVGRCETRGDICQDVSVQVVRQCRVEVALVRQLRTELRRTHRASIVLGVTQTWLSKSLLQPKRRFRAPLLFGHVLELHLAARGRDVVLVGGLPLPEPLATAMNARIDELAREAASKSVSDVSGGHGRDGRFDLACARPGGVARAVSLEVHRRSRVSRIRACSRVKPPVSTDFPS